MADTTNSTSARLTNGRPSTWGQAYAEYRHLRAVADAIPAGEPGCDEAVEAYCKAQDHLLDNVPAPNLDAIVVKMQLTKERFDGFNIPDSTMDALIADVRGISTPAPQTNSLILALHARYEAAWAEYNRIDAAQPSRDSEDTHDQRLYFDCERAMGENTNETDSLRNTLLYQVPTTDEELTILSCHAWSLYDEATDLTDAERKAVEQALTSIFNYLMSEGRADIDSHGHTFRKAALIAFGRVNRRTGTMED